VSVDSQQHQQEQCAGSGGKTLSPMHTALKFLASFNNHEEACNMLLWKRPGSNPGPWIPKQSAMTTALHARCTRFYIWEICLTWDIRGVVSGGACSLLLVHSGSTWDESQVTPVLSHKQHFDSVIQYACPVLPGLSHTTRLCPLCCNNCLTAVSLRVSSLVL
jgi:hypothetical protein